MYFEQCFFKDEDSCTHTFYLSNNIEKILVEDGRGTILFNSTVLYITIHVYVCTTVSVYMYNENRSTLI